MPKLCKMVLIYSSFDIKEKQQLKCYGSWSPNLSLEGWWYIDYIVISYWYTLAIILEGTLKYLSFVFRFYSNLLTKLKLKYLHRIHIHSTNSAKNTFGKKMFLFALMCFKSKQICIIDREEKRTIIMGFFRQFTCLA